MMETQPQKTVLYVNVASFVKIVKDVMGGDGEIRALLWEQIGMAVDEFGGTIEQRERRHMLATWDSPEQAVRSALAMQKVMRGMRVGLVEGDVMPMQIGISTGAVAARADEESGETTLMGAAVTMAEQLGQLLDKESTDGKILLAESTHAAVQAVFELEPDPVSAAYRLLGEKNASDAAASGDAISGDAASGDAASNDDGDDKKRGFWPFG